MEEHFAALEQAFRDYLQDLENYEKKRRPTDGLLGFGRSLKDDPCHERLDERVEKAVGEICASAPSPGEAERTVRMLLRDDMQAWPLAAQWMLRAIERHAIPLIPFLTRETAAALLKEYAERYRPWDRLPVQREVHKALKLQAGMKR